MSKKIVIDKHQWDFIMQYIKEHMNTIVHIVNITEIDTDQSIEERIKHYPTAVRVHVLQAMTEQSLIEQMKTKEFAEWCSINGWHYSTASKGWHTPFHIHDFFTTE